jgi:hypothetical protein
MSIDLDYDVIDKAKMVRGRRQNEIQKGLFESSIIRITILGLLQKQLLLLRWSKM